MARYDLTNDFIQLTETSGVIENISNTPVEISSQNVRRTGIILYPQQRYIFNGTTYAAREQNATSPAAIAVETNIPRGGGGSSIDLTPAINAVNTTLQTINTNVSVVGSLSKETTHQRIADALEDLVEKDGKGNGLSAYEIALGNGFKGTVQEWLASLKGDKGDKGDGADYELPVASDSVLGGVKVGNTLSIDSLGALDYNLPTASDSILGGVKIGNTLSIDSVTGRLDYNLPIGTDTILGGVKSSSVAGGIRINSDGTMQSSVFVGASDSVGGSVGLVPAPIAGEEEYFLKGNGSWAIPPEGGGGGGAGNYKQITKMNVTASSSVPYEVSATLPRSTTFLYSPPNVLLFVPGDTNIVATACDFNNGDAADFVFDDKYVVFDGTMHLKTEYNVDMGAGVTLGSGKLFTSETVDLSDYKTVESVAASYETAVGIALIASGGGSGTWARTEINDKTIIISSTGVAYDFAGNQLATNWTSLTDADKIAAINNAVYGDPITTMETLGTFSFATYTEGTDTPFCTLTAVPKDQLITPSGLISLEDFDAINSVTMTASVNGNAALLFAVTTDRETYYVYDATEGEWAALAAATAANILEDGMTTSEIAAVPKAAWTALIEGSNGIGFAYALSMTDTTETLLVDAVTLNVDMKGSWRAAIHGDEYAFDYPNNRSMRFSLYVSGNWKINYDAGQEEEGSV